MSVPINYAALHPFDLATVIEAADPTVLQQIDADLKREGWASSGVRRARIAARLADLTTS